MSGVNFDHVVIIAMENQNYASVMGTGTGTSNAPFISSILNSGHSVTFPNYHSYGNRPGLPSIGGCSAGCYAALDSGSTYGVTDGSWGSFSGATTIIDRFMADGISWQAYCEAGCPRGNDHFPFTASSTLSGNPNIFTSGSVNTGSFIAAANSASAPSFLWYTPTDSNNMHNNGVSSGDSYLQGFLVGSGTLSAPASGSLLASSVFNYGKRTLLLLWWDEYDPSPQLFYSPTLLSSSTIDTGNAYTEYSWLSMWEKNWGLKSLTANDGGAVVPNSFGTVRPPTTCTNGTTNPPTCTTCPHGQTLTNGICQTIAITSGSFSPTSTSNSATAWFPNTHSGAPSSSTITNGVLNLLVVNTASSYTGTYNAVAILGCGDYCGIPPITGPLSGPPTSISVSGIFNSLTLSNPTVNDFKVGMRLYFLFASPQTGTTCSATVTGRTWLDTEVQFSYMSNGVYQPANGFSYIGCGGSSTLTYRETETAVQPGQPFSITNFNVTAFYQRALAKQGLPASTAATLWGIEPGVEGYGLSNLAATYQYAIGCPAGSSFANGACMTAPPTSCSNGATNPSGCNVCPAGQNLVNGVCKTNTITSGSFDPTSTSNSATAWFPNAHSGAPSSSTITNGVLNLLVVNTASSYTGTYNAVSILGCADYCGTPSPTTALAGPPASLSVSGIFNSLSLSNQTTNDFKVEVSLYFLFASPQNGTTCSAAVSGRIWLDTEVQFSYMSNGVYQPSVNGYIGCGGSSTITYRETVSATQPGQPFSITNFNITAFYRRALVMQGLPPTTPASLYGIEPGAEGYGLASLSATYQYAVACPAGSTFSNGACTNILPVTCSNGTTNPPYCDICPLGQNVVNGVCTTVPPVTVSFTYTPLNPIVGQNVVFLGTGRGGIPPYTFNWNFGDNISSAENPAMHTYTTPGLFLVSVTTTRADGVSSTSIRTLAVAASLSASFAFSPLSPNAGDNVSFVGSASGGIQPYGYSWSFGDSSTGWWGSSVSHTFQARGSYTVILTVTDVSNRTVNTTETITVNHQGHCNASCVQDIRHAATFNPIATGATALYIFTLFFTSLYNPFGPLPDVALCFVLVWMRKLRRSNYSIRPALT